MYRRKRRSMVSSDRQIKGFDLLDPGQIRIAPSRSVRCISVHLYGAVDPATGIARAEGATEMANASSASPVLSREAPTAAPRQRRAGAGLAGTGNARHRRNLAAKDARGTVAPRGD